MGPVERVCLHALYYLILFTGSISPYVTLEIKKWMIEVKGRKQQKGKTPVVKHSNEPVWEADRTTFTLYYNLQHVTHPLVILWT